jgi:hypothetical protein
MYAAGTPSEDCKDKSRKRDRDASKRVPVADTGNTAGGRGGQRVDRMRCCHTDQEQRRPGNHQANAQDALRRHVGGFCRVLIPADRRAAGHELTCCKYLALASVRRLTFQEAE